MGLRRRSREKTLQILYSMEFNRKNSVEEAVGIYLKYFNINSSKNCDNETPEEENVFIVYLLNTVSRNLSEIERLIEEAATNWRIERIALIERNILRMSVAELIDETNGVPFKATINEAIDIAKKFGSKESSSFVNGIINKVADIIDIKSKKL
ncbi:MAG TPA: transcription antitermination factor NusB [bacterium]|jgi:N utilization substance protein B|nr:transcription antitermination factor NusB [bacterium]MDX9805279.1 transcription antitermination factor NusB [bacterium]HNZ54476.1 transcription antitermination factor NusB [bacterium]HOG43025.1 transcription antitermination factor NusB [bacterium]HPA56701.1 transcription antitermination factor NusB [bacterium]